MSRRKRSGRNPYQRDRFTQQAKEEGFAARSVFKLQEIQRRFRLLAPGQRAVDLGCSPGSWWRYAAQCVGRGGTVLGVDIHEPEVICGPLLVRSVLEVSADDIVEALEGAPDVVLSDMAPRTTGDPFGDHVRQIELARRALGLAVALLPEGGGFVVKVFDGEEAHDFVMDVRRHFGKVKRVKPEATRKVSREFFVVAQDRRPGEPA
ncbi:MAG: RlmE family RNA methyltransferase [Myxococcota bacterium]